MSEYENTYEPTQEEIETFQREACADFYSMWEHLAHWQWEDATGKREDIA